MKVNVVKDGSSPSVAESIGVIHRKTDITTAEVEVPSNVEKRILRKKSSTRMMDEPEFLKMDKK